MLPGINMLLIILVFIIFFLKKNVIKNLNGKKYNIEGYPGKTCLKGIKNLFETMKGSRASDTKMITSKLIKIKS